MFKTSALMWLSVVVLSLSTFMVVTADFAPVGLLTPMALGLNQSESMIGLTVTLYSWTGAISGLLVVIFFGNLPKKALLASFTLIMLFSNILCAVAIDYTVLLVARVIGGIANGALWAMVFVVAMSLVPPRNIGLATAIVFGGVSAGNLLGVPFTSFVGNRWTWQTAFWMIAVISLISLICILLFVPNIKTRNIVDRKAFKKVLSHPMLLKVYLAAFITVAAYFCAFTFIEPYLQASPFISGNLISVMLFVFGAAGILGNFLTGVFIDKYLKMVVLISTSLIAIAIIILGFFATAFGQLTIIFLIAVWGVSVSGVFIGFQTWLLRADPENAFPASAVYSALFNIAIGLGALAGSGMVAKFNIFLLMACSGIAVASSLLPIAMIPGFDNSKES